VVVSRRKRRGVSDRRETPSWGRGRVERTEGNSRGLSAKGHSKGHSSVEKVIEGAIQGSV